MTTAAFYTRDELYDWGKRLEYSGEQLREVAFPLGGIGTGCVSLSGRGSLVDWEIYNRPNKGTLLPYAFFTLWARPEGGEPVTRVLQGRRRRRLAARGARTLAASALASPAWMARACRTCATCASGASSLAWVSLSDPAMPMEVELRPTALYPGERR